MILSFLLVISSVLPQNIPIFLTSALCQICDLFFFNFYYTLTYMHTYMDNMCLCIPKYINKTFLVCVTILAFWYFKRWQFGQWINNLCLFNRDYFYYWLYSLVAVFLSLGLRLHNIFPFMSACLLVLSFVMSCFGNCVGETSQLWFLTQPHLCSILHALINVLPHLSQGFLKDFFQKLRPIWIIGIVFHTAKFWSFMGFCGDFYLLKKNKFPY